MAYRSRVFYTGTGGEQNLSVTFPYLDISHVHAYFDEVLQEDDTWSWLNSATITLTATSGAVVELRRSTPLDPMVTFTNASLLNQDDQNMAALQAIYLIEEGADVSVIVQEELDAHQSSALTFIFDGGGFELEPAQEIPLLVPFACTIKRVYLIGDTIGSVSVDLWKSSYGNLPAAAGDSIVASAPPVLDTEQTYYDATLTGWTLPVAANSILVAQMTSVSALKRLTVSVVVDRT